MSKVRGTPDWRWLLCALVILTLASACPKEGTSHAIETSPQRPADPSKAQQVRPLDERKVTVTNEVTGTGALARKVKMNIDSGRPTNDLFTGYTVLRVDEDNKTLFNHPSDMNELCQVILTMASDVKLKERGSPTVSTQLVFDPQKWALSGTEYTSNDADGSQLEQIEIKCPSISVVRNCIDVRCGKIEIRLKK